MKQVRRVNLVCPDPLEGQEAPASLDLWVLRVSEGTRDLLGTPEPQDLKD